MNELKIEIHKIDINSLYHYLKQNIPSYSEFDEDYKKNKWIELFCENYNPKDLEKLFKKILRGKKSKRFKGYKLLIFK